MKEFDKLPQRVRYYLLDWKDCNMEKFKKEYGHSGLRALKRSELHELFSYATTIDRKNIAK